MPGFAGVAPEENPSFDNWTKQIIDFIRKENMDYIKSLLSIKKQEYRQQHIILNLYFLFLSLGFVLYSYEYTFFRSFFFGIVAYTVLLIWIGLNWFVFRPRIIKKRKRKFADFMKYIESYNGLLAE